MACDNKSTFDLYFIPSLEHQSCGRPCLFSTEYIWTLEITQSILAASGPLRLPNYAMTYLNHCGQHMTILRKFGPPLQWNVVVLHIGMGKRYVIQSWYQFLMDNNFCHGDEVSFYYRKTTKIWEIVIRRKKKTGIIKFSSSSLTYVFFALFLNNLVIFL
ncbi:hypothetical protein JHK86_043597 [Glycine max]|nr:hypothetical protein JHK86_043597 [Glycine max]